VSLYRKIGTAPGGEAHVDDCTALGRPAVILGSRRGVGVRAPAAARRLSTGDGMATSSTTTPIRYSTAVIESLVRFAPMWRSGRRVLGHPGHGLSPFFLPEGHR